MKTELRFWSYLILSISIGMIVALKSMMLVMDILIKYDVVGWTEALILVIVFICVFTLVCGCVIFAIDKLWY